MKEIHDRKIIGDYHDYKAFPDPVYGCFSNVDVFFK